MYTQVYLNNALKKAIMIKKREELEESLTHFLEKRNDRTFPNYPGLDNPDDLR